MITKNIILTSSILAMTTLLKAQDKVVAKSINERAPVKCSKSILIQASPETVWSVLTNINDWNQWQTDISYAQLGGPLKPNATFTWKMNGAKIHSTLHTVKSAQVVGWTGKSLGVYAIHNWYLEEENGGTRVTVNESMEGFLAGLFNKTFNKSLDKGIANWLERLKLKSGEVEMKAKLANSTY